MPKVRKMKISDLIEKLNILLRNHQDLSKEEVATLKEVVDLAQEYQSKGLE